jgi:pimeloyl-ACP methyl ester carboxylesterase
MIYYLSHYLLDLAKETAWQEELSFLRLFRYITFRSAGAFVTALILSLWLGPKVIAWLKRLKFGQEYVDKAEEAGRIETRVISKKGTPTMGGILIVAVMDVTALLWAQWNPLVSLTLISVLVLAGLGFYDDYAKITQPVLVLWAEGEKIVPKVALHKIREHLPQSEVVIIDSAGHLLLEEQPDACNTVIRRFLHAPSARREAVPVTVDEGAVPA